MAVENTWIVNNVTTFSVLNIHIWQLDKINVYMFLYMDIILFSYHFIIIFASYVCHKFWQWFVNLYGFFFSEQNMTILSYRIV